MSEPTSPAEFFCIINRLIESGAFDSVGSRQELAAAHQEIARAMFNAAGSGTTPSACERLVGSLFVRACEQTVTPSAPLVTPEEPSP